MTNSPDDWKRKLDFALDAIARGLEAGGLTDAPAPPGSFKAPPHVTPTRMPEPFYVLDGGGEGMCILAFPEPHLIFFCGQADAVKALAIVERISAHSPWGNGGSFRLASALTVRELCKASAFKQGDTCQHPQSGPNSRHYLFTCL